MADAVKRAECARMGELTPLLEPHAAKMHSLGTLTRLLPGPLGTLVLVAASLCLVAAAYAAWRHAIDWRVRFGVLVLASALANPHLTIFDVTILALPILWIGGGWRVSQAITPGSGSASTG